MFTAFLDPVVNHFRRQTLPTVKRKHFFMNILYTEPFCPQKRTTKRCSSVVNISSTVAILTTETSLWTCARTSSTQTFYLKNACIYKNGLGSAHPILVSRLSWSWTVLLHSDTDRKPTTSITAVSRPFVTYLLTLPRSIQLNYCMNFTCFRSLFP
jgi:hypothetical protein